MTDIAICLRVAADSLACARFCPSETDVAREYAALAVAELPADLAAQVERALDCGSYLALDELAFALEPPAAPTPEPRSRRQRKPTLASAIREARKAGVPVSGATLTADGSVSLTFGGEPKTSRNELDEWMARHHADSTKGHKGH